MMKPRLFGTLMRKSFPHSWGSSVLNSSRPEKPYYVTTPIFYVNADPHIGHLYSLVVADIFKRWAVVRGKKAILCTGTDEHGMKIQRAALVAKKDVRAFCDQNSEGFKLLAQSADISQNHFIRTSEPAHRFAVQHFWLMLQERGHIYASKHQGWYSVSDETFYPESAVHLILNPSTGRKFMASKETGKEVEWTSEKNYHFRMSAFKDRLLEFYAQNPNFITPATRMREIVTQVESGLEDLSISRPAERLSWGIPVPDDKTQTIYVWMDALINYLTKSNYPFQIPGQEEAAGWPANLHVIGKDIIRFHAIYWPAFLLALDLPLPQRILAHAHWTLGKEKMSKSLGNVVNPFFAIKRFGVDGMRYFLARNGGIKDDAMYDNSFIIERYKIDLQFGLGNLLSRVVRGKGWSVRQAVQLHQLPTETTAPMLIDALKHLPTIVSNILETNLDIGMALQTIMEAARQTNQYMQVSSPWDLVSPPPAPNAPELSRIIYLCAESLRICGILLQPYMPSKTAMMLDLLGVAPDARTFAYAALGADEGYGTPAVAIGTGRDDSVFPPLRSHF